MHTAWSFLTSRLGEFSSFEVSVLVLNVLLLIFAKPLFRVLSHGNFDAKVIQARLHIYRAINALIIVLVLSYQLYLPIAGDSWITKLIGALLVLYCTHLAYHVLGYFINAGFGKRRTVDGKKLISGVKAMVNAAFEKAEEDDGVAVRDQYPLEVHVANTGDHAVEWVIYYYLTEVRLLIATRQWLREIVLQYANEHGISLATPLRHEVLSSSNSDA